MELSITETEIAAAVAEYMKKGTYCEIRDIQFETDEDGNVTATAELVAKNK